MWLKKGKVGFTSVLVGVLRRGKANSADKGKSPIPSQHETVDL